MNQQQQRKGSSKGVIWIVILALFAGMIWQIMGGKLDLRRGDPAPREIPVTTWTEGN